MTNLKPSDSGLRRSCGPATLVNRLSGRSISFLIATLIFLVPATIGLYASVRILPPLLSNDPYSFFSILRSGRREISSFGPVEPNVNRLGFRPGTLAYRFQFDIFLVAVYLVKYYLQRKFSKPEASYWYFWLVATSLSYIWFCISTEWYNPFVYRVACWTGDPFAVWLVPTISFMYDIRKASQPTFHTYLVRSIAEQIIGYSVVGIVLGVLFLCVGWFEL